MRCLSGPAGSDLPLLTALLSCERALLSALESHPERGALNRTLAARVDISIEHTRTSGYTASLEPRFQPFAALEVKLADHLRTINRRLSERRLVPPDFSRSRRRLGTSTRLGGRLTHLAAITTGAATDRAVKNGLRLLARWVYCKCIFYSFRAIAVNGQVRIMFHARRANTSCVTRFVCTRAVVQLPVTRRLRREPREFRATYKAPDLTASSAKGLFALIFARNPLRESIVPVTNRPSTYIGPFAVDFTHKGILNWLSLFFPPYCSVISNMMYRTLTRTTTCKAHRKFKYKRAHISSRGIETDPS